MKTHLLYSKKETRQLAEELAKTCPLGSLWLMGDLGSGKTTFTRFFLQALGYKGKVKSPTYTLVEPYCIKNGYVDMIYHSDLYRLNDPEELDFIGFFEYFHPNNLVIIEWAERAKTLLPPPDIILTLTILDDNIRQATIDYPKT